MSRYTINDLKVHGIDQSLITEAIETIMIIQAQFTQPYYCVVFRFHEAPEALLKVCCLNGGDEDWLVVMAGQEEEPDWLPRWISHMDSCDDPDVYIISNSIVYVGSHA
jgi:hypothetical protein